MTTTISWYAIRVRPVHRLEFEVMHALNQREHEAMVPHELKWERRRGKKIQEQNRYPFFPCYVFAAFQHIGEFNAAKTFINKLAEAKGKRPPIVALVGYGSQPAVLSAGDVSFLRSLSTPRLTSVNLHKALVEGQGVRITQGPFAGHDAKVESVNRKRVKVLLQFLDGLHAVEINPASLVAA